MHWCSSVNGSKLWMMVKCGKSFVVLSRCLQDKGSAESGTVKVEKDIIFKTPKYKGVLATALVPPVGLLDMAKVCS